ncbi:GxxExxY protein [uncultured Fluviicola sp.]|uniref:GxxExxY protein n=1 Tax=uncultured Fluviicola sp. TaxID=463303 RepID=UPI0025EE1079|nr:GxxExxY protein [uncultured Fluviicola sp.]
MSENELSSIIIGAAIEVHTQLGPGLLESIYETCLYHELKEIGLKVERQVEVPLIYKNLFLETGLKLDLIVEDKVIIELKAVKEICDVHLAQTLTYLKLTNLKLGLLINFNETRLKHGLRRVVYNI